MTSIFLTYLWPMRKKNEVRVSNHALIKLKRALSVSFKELKNFSSSSIVINSLSSVFEKLFWAEYWTFKIFDDVMEWSCASSNFIFALSILRNAGNYSIFWLLWWRALLAYCIDPHFSENHHYIFVQRCPRTVTIQCFNCMRHTSKLRMSFLSSIFPFLSFKPAL